MAEQSSTMHTLKQVLKMAACCAGPILGIALLAPLAASLGIGVSSVLSTLLVLACPLSMLIMMYFMMRGEKAERQDHRRAAEQPRPEMATSDAAVTMAEGSGQLEGREALYAPEARQPSVASQRTMQRQAPQATKVKQSSEEHGIGGGCSDIVAQKRTREGGQARCRN